MDTSQTEAAKESHQQIAEALKKRRLQKFSHLTDLCRSGSYKVGGTDYQAFLSFEKGYFSGYADESGTRRLSNYLSSIGMGSDEQAQVILRIRESKRAPESYQRKEKLPVEEERSERPIIFSPVHGRPGMWIGRKSREGGGMVWGDNTYQVMVQNLTTLGGREEVGLDEVVQYALMIRDYHRALAHMGRKFVEQVRNPEGTDYNGLKMKMSLEQLAEGTFAGGNPSVALGILSLSLIVPSLFEWSKKVQSNRTKEEISVPVDEPDDLRDAAFGAVRNKLLFLKSQGYVSAELGLDVFDKSKTNYDQVVTDVKTLLVDAAKLYVSQKSKLS